jgi:uncharacterized protein with PQ loop repeat
MNKENVVIPYTATSISILARFIFMFLLYRNKSTNNYSLIFCLLSVCSSSMWLKYSIEINDNALIYRSSTELTLLSISSIYIIKNKLFGSSSQIHNKIENSNTNQENRINIIA